MAHVAVHRDDVELDEPMLVEGLPGIGLVGKIAADHLVSEFDMTHYASIHCDGLPQLAVYQRGESGVRAPVRLYTDEDRDLLVLSSDVPVSPNGAEQFATCVTEWNEANDVTPIYLSGLPAEKGDVPALSGIATGNAGGLLAEADLDAPDQDGAITGPTGALIYEAERRGLDSVGLVVESNKQFPDPEAARVILLEGVGPLTGVDVDTETLVEQAEEISDAKAELAQQMQQGTDESTSAEPLGMYQ
jgi:uncharacterized protein